MLKIEDLNAGYGKMQILHGVSMSIMPNEIVALIGPNGAGKSTLIKAIFKLVDIFSGRITYKDENISNLTSSELVELGISYVPQGGEIFHTLSLVENLEMGGFIIKDRDILEERIEKVFRIFPNLEDKRNEKALGLSGGERRMLSLGIALMLDPNVLLLDEPSAGLAPKAMNDVFEKIAEIKKEGAAILLVEQNAKKAISIADRTYVLEAGRIVLSGGKNIAKNSKIKHVYLGGV